MKSVSHILVFLAYSRRHRLASRLLLFGFWLFTALARPAAAQEHWLTGTALERQRQQPLSLNWSGVPVRNGLGEIARLQQAAILLDRRIDPERTVNLSVRQESLDDLLSQIAEKVDGGATWLGPVAYVGPRAAAARLRTRAALGAADLRTLANEERAPFLISKAWGWDDLAEPRELLAGLAAEANVELARLDEIPHDLWPAASLPPLSWLDRMTLVANEFDFTYQIVDKDHVRLLPIEGPVVMERSYPAGNRGDDLAARWRRLAPEAQIEVARGKIVVRGRLEDHERLHPPKAAPSAIKPGGRPSEKVYTLTVPNQPLAAVLDKLRESSIEITVDDAALQKAGLTIERRVSFKVERATLEELLAAALKPAGLTFLRRGHAFEIIPANRPSDR